MFAQDIASFCERCIKNRLLFFNLDLHFLLEIKTKTFYFVKNEFLYFYAKRFPRDYFTLLSMAFFCFLF